MSEVHSDVEVRRAQVLLLHSRGLRQDEIAAKLGIDQSTVSRDLKELRRQSGEVIKRRVVEDSLFEFYRWDAGMEEVMKKAWEVAGDEKATSRTKVKTLAFLVKCYNCRLDTLVRGPGRGHDASGHVQDMHENLGVYALDNKFGRPQDLSNQ